MTYKIIFVIEFFTCNIINKRPELLNSIKDEEIRPNYLHD